MLGIPKSYVLSNIKELLAKAKADIDRHISYRCEAAYNYVSSRGKQGYRGTHVCF